MNGRAGELGEEGEGVVAAFNVHIITFLHMCFYRLYGHQKVFGTVFVALLVLHWSVCVCVCVNMVYSFVQTVCSGKNSLNVVVSLV